MKIKPHELVTFLLGLIKSTIVDLARGFSRQIHGNCLTRVVTFKHRQGCGFIQPLTNSLGPIKSF
jgi:hypothetical protein